jgi:hypothetical protein
VKIGTENKKELWTMVVLLVIAIPSLIYAVRSSGAFSSSSAASPSTAPAPRPEQQKKSAVPQVRDSNLDPTLRLDKLQAAQKITYEGGKRNIFRMEEPPPPPPVKPLAPVVTGPVQPPPPPPPPQIPLKFFGFSSKPGEPKKAFVSKDDEVFVAKEGDVIDRRYKIIQINSGSILVEDSLYNNRQTIPLTAPQG